MNKRISVGVSAAIVIIAVTITFTATMIFSMKLYDQKVLSVKERAQMYNTVYELDTLVRENYYKSIDDASVSQSMLYGFIGGLEDPYSRYLSAAELSEAEMSNEGVGVSLGITVAKNSDGYLLIKSVVSGSSADEKGLKQGDIITKVNDQDVLELGYDLAAAQLDVAEGTTVTVDANRDGREIITDLVCSSMELPTVENMLDDQIGYIRISSFNKLTTAQFDYALNTLTSNGIKGLLIDLRDNGDGYNIDSCAAVLDMLCPTGTLVSGTYADGSTKVLYTSGDDRINIPVVLLVNERTEYLGELFAAVMRDMLGCEIVGDTTVGHGTMQSILKMTDGSGLLLTVATLNPPSSNGFDGTGITPDYEVPTEEGFTVGSQIPSATTDAQYKKAYDVLKAQITG